MAERHAVIDKDPRFKIDLITRAISTESKKIALIQGDHNSERFTFELSRKVEGHEMPECDKVEVHYINVDAKTKEESAGVYLVDDVTITEEDPEKISFSWLVSHQATKHQGSLSFLVRFSCHDEKGALSYVWNSAIYTGISISNGIDNGEAVIEDYADILNDWKHDLEANQVISLVQTQEGDGDEGENIWTATFGDGRTSELRVKNGSKGDTGLIGSIETITGEPLYFFVGTHEEFNALSEEIRNQKNIFALFTDKNDKEELDQTLAGFEDGTTPVGCAKNLANCTELEYDEEGQGFKVTEPGVYMLIGYNTGAASEAERIYRTDTIAIPDITRKAYGSTYGSSENLLSWYDSYDLVNYPWAQRYFRLSFNASKVINYKAFKIASL